MYTNIYILNVPLFMYFMYITSCIYIVCTYTLYNTCLAGRKNCVLNLMSKFKLHM